MIECWASPLQDCGTEASKEHLVSAALWPGATLLVTGFDWCRDELKEVGVNSLTSQILCKKHNNGLSDLDSAAGAAFDRLRRAIVLVNERLKGHPPWAVEDLRIEQALLLERWFLKTMLNIIVVRPGELRWRQTGAEARTIPARLLRIAFGKEPFAKPMGLYVSAPLGQRLRLSESVTFAPLLYDGPNIVGGLFGLAGWQFLIHLEPIELPADLVLPSVLEGAQPAGLHYHLIGMDNRVGTELSHTITFNWS